MLNSLFFQAYKHINTTCSQLMLATEAFQNRIFGE